MTSQQLLYIGDATFFGEPLSVMVTAVDAQSGTKCWQTTLAQSNSTSGNSSLQFADGALYATYASPGALFPDSLKVLDARDGKLLWHYQADEQQHEQILMIYVDQEILCLYMLDERTNVRLEVYRVKDYQRLWGFSSTRLQVPLGRVLTKQIFYLASYSQLFMHQSYTIQAVRSSDGKKLWHTKLALAIKQITATDHALYVTYDLTPPNGTMEVRALSSHDGSLLWKYTLPNHRPISNIIVLNSVLYLADSSYLTALDALDGRHLWTKEERYDLGFHTEDHILYAQHHNAEEMCALDPQTGNILWRTKIEEAGFFTVTDENTIYTAVNFSGMVHALQKSNGQLLWNYENHVSHRIFGLAVGEVTNS